jgi:hypothetical protein
MQAVFDMASWRINFLKWQQNAQNVSQTLTATTAATKTSSNSIANTPQ